MHAGGSMILLFVLDVNVCCFLYSCPYANDVPTLLLRTCAMLLSQARSNGTLCVCFVC